MRLCDAVAYFIHSPAIRVYNHLDHRTVTAFSLRVCARYFCIICGERAQLGMSYKSRQQVGTTIFCAAELRVVIRICVRSVSQFIGMKYV